MGITILSLIATLLINGVQKEQLKEVKIYSETAVVVDVNEKDNIITCLSFNGNEWQFEEENGEEWIEGDIVAMTMCDNGTEEVKDDIIINTKYCGWVTEWSYGKDKIFFK